ncbi:pyruvate dehydrogenase (acetyl-transferring) E1 component subunit alpha [Phenylobacterium sp. Root77]|jgi:pyruvate dehydrogenase E1 component alpha subunit|uniref:pyruvate dehydrogenase (acetyl-transferring) E1 component subunit alpha n=1 Tax=unclassified Phenylobacterium TaxID=2640670 RepID=UPI0006F4DF44|nr:MULTISPECIES: pyruvate dehydrogenase (acetyl-transferring) E1 component subunit alpha [unclassified Phenylobacterium]KQW71576.1 pyruvate dehydrogenase (acetyl-transferring) E1 component subunit alpha [Phenylobacterium sp. Root1277]KQW94496.1 pyruvate dehydrogenase (acetyl-transferring) E1 component subunit alpha [Phenylobacterium sp. Root1290]KRC44190.1 pyruvate dehydrogenase (acetyl-transferring) E1 component subunit alpha [Phenylobacterium sp. Root77]
MARGQTSSAAKRKSSDSNAGGGAAGAVTKDELLKYYRDMLLIRRFEERAGQLYGMGLIGGFCHLYIGQEAIAVGVQAIKESGDQVITGYRDHGHMLACGMDPREVMAELTGRAGGSSKGKGGSMHMFSTEADFYGGHGIVGAQVALGTGLALANHYRDNKKVSFTYFGDGAANQGQVYESFNMARLWNLPVVYVIENNQYAMGTSIERSSSETHLYKRGSSFRIPGEEVDGMDVLAVKAAAQKAADHARSGEGPYILEMKTYRYRGHSMSDPAKYRTRDEVDEVRKTRDPIDHAQELLAKKGWADEAALKAIDAEVKAIVADAAEFARTSPEPEASELYTDVYLEAAE